MRRSRHWRPANLTQSTLGDLDAWSPQVWQRFDLRVMMHGGRTPDDAPPARFIALSRELEDDELSVVSWSLPLAWSMAHPAATFVSAVLELCELVQPVHGYAGLGLSPHLTGTDVESDPPLRALLARYAGLTRDMLEDAAITLSGRDAIAGVNWLTTCRATFSPSTTVKRSCWRSSVRMHAATASHAVSCCKQVPHRVGSTRRRARSRRSIPRSGLPWRRSFSNRGWGRVSADLGRGGKRNGFHVCEAGGASCVARELRARVGKLRIRRAKLRARG